MPTYYVNPFGLQTPTTTTADPSLPSTILPDSPELDRPNIDTRSNTPDGDTQLRVDDIPGYKARPPSPPVASGCDSAQGAPRDWRRQP
ncbi:hypothetical protein PGTUg99_029993 [Puccinia graminis f. sp. tritici]|uniref:Uncharacterized protein n=1 Tax=Puccinia graminis f. sp. tritici TaxID=56615 RepID=A0A5B0RGR6_PUCGR|nr:hypothetical protein PGTUg99_029993 [Puccinia graminis f. sp. tritici]